MFAKTVPVKGCESRNRNLEDLYRSIWNYVKQKNQKMTIPRLELGISRVSGERVSHCTIQS